MRVVVDTNVLVSAISPVSEHHWLYQAIFDGRFELCVSTDILLEYAEILERFYGHSVSEFVSAALLYSPFVVQIHPSFFWKLIKQDPDDNKFVDCAIAASANFIVTYDRHFKVLANVEFPEVKIINPKDFKQLLDSL
jgi:putative PIN family toxin of toxin-antitoxin system